MPESAASTVPRGLGETVLIVEDEPSVLALSRRMLEGLGYHVLTASGQHDAINLIDDRAHAVHLVITDVIMPDVNGRELAAQLSRIRPGLRFLYISGYPAGVVISRGMIDEGVTFLQKPFSIAALAAKVREVLDGG